MIPLKDTQPARIFPFWVVVIITINIYVFYLELTSINPEVFINKYALIPAAVEWMDWSTWLPFITSQFIHGGFLHIISNILFLWVFGGNVEERMGFLFPIFYLASGVVGGLTEYVFTIESTIPMLGASGSVAGILGAYFALFPRHKITTLVPIIVFFAIIKIPASIMLIYWFSLQLLQGFTSIDSQDTSSLGGIAYFAHIGGFVFGWFIGRLIKVSKAG